MGRAAGVRAPGAAIASVAFANFALLCLKRKEGEGAWSGARARQEPMSRIDKLHKRTSLGPDSFPRGFPYGTCLYTGPRVIRERLRDQESGALRMVRHMDASYYELQGDKGQEWHTRLEHPTLDYTSHFRKVFGVVREVRREDRGAGWSIQFTDQRHDMTERARCVHLATRREVHYEGKVGAFRVTAMHHPNGRVIYFEGGPGAERKVRTVHPKCNRVAVGFIVHFAGPRRFCHVERIVYDDGRVSYFTGGFGNERLVKRLTTKGTVQIFEGERGAERKVEERPLNGNVFFFKGEKDAERCVRAITDNGRKISLYRGEKGREWLHQGIVFGDDGDTVSVMHMTGERGAEQRKRMLHEDGRLELFAGGTLWREHAWRTVDADGHVHTIEAPPHAPEDWQFDDPAVPVHKKQRIQNATMELWNQMEALVEQGDMTEQALLVVGGTFQSLRSEVAD